MTDILDCKLWCVFFSLLIVLLQYFGIHVINVQKRFSRKFWLKSDSGKKSGEKIININFSNYDHNFWRQEEKVRLKMKWKSRNHKFISADGLLGTPVGKNSLFMIIFDNFYELFGLVFMAIKPSYQPQTLSKMYIHTNMKTLGANRIILEYTTN